MHHHLWSEIPENGYSMWLIVRFDLIARVRVKLSLENGASEGEIHAIKKLPKLAR